MSPTRSIGMRTPVEDLASKTKTNKATIMTLMPLIPDLDKPKTKAAAKTTVQSINVKAENTSSFSGSLFIDYLKVVPTALFYNNLFAFNKIINSGLVVVFYCNHF